MTFPALKHKKTNLVSSHDRGIFTLACSVLAAAVRAGDPSVALEAPSRSTAVFWGDQRASRVSAGSGPSASASSHRGQQSPQPGQASIMKCLSVPPSSHRPSGEYWDFTTYSRRFLQLFAPFPANTNSINPDVWRQLRFLRAKETGLLSVRAPSALLPSLPVVFCSRCHVSSTAGERRASSAGKATRKQPAPFVCRCARQERRYECSEYENRKKKKGRRHRASPPHSLHAGSATARLPSACAELAWQNLVRTRLLLPRGTEELRLLTGKRDRPVKKRPLHAADR